MTNIIKAWYFDAQGNSIKEEFENEKQAKEFAINHGLEVFKMMAMPKMVYKDLYKA